MATTATFATPTLTTTTKKINRIQEPYQGTIQGSLLTLMILSPFAGREYIIYIIHFSCLYIHLITLFGYIILKTRQGTFVGSEMDNQMDPHGSFDGTLAKKGSSKILSEFSNLNTLDLSLVMLAAGIQLMRSYQVFYQQSSYYQT